MKTRLYLFIAVVFSIVSLSCEQIIEIELPERPTKIVINSMINPDSLLCVNLTKSKGSLEDVDNIRFINNAIVKLYEDGNFVQDLTYNSSGNYYADLRPQAGKLYSLEASAESLSPVSAQCLVPPQTTILSVDSLSVIESSEDMYGYQYGTEIRYVIKFVDEPGTNYYRLRVFANTCFIDHYTNPEFNDTICYLM